MEPRIKEKYIDTGKVRLVWHNMAWIGNESRRAAEAAACAHEQGQFWEYQARLYANQKGYNAGAFSDKNLKAHAEALGLDVNRFGTCLAAGTYVQVVSDELKQAREQFITATPTFRVNNKLVIGYQSFARWEEIIEAALKEKGN